MLEGLLISNRNIFCTGLLLFAWKQANYIKTNVLFAGAAQWSVTLEGITLHHLVVILTLCFPTLYNFLFVFQFTVYLSVTVCWQANMLSGFGVIVTSQGIEIKTGGR